ncbi:hypothetical protein SNEBB_002404 [Seison nebaliae]|nr:hypothetical protein SNEBB_002404 [Seison nebaliae]
MDLPQDFALHTAPQRSNLLNYLGINSMKKVRGFYNAPDLQVCATNVLLAMITSSANLMQYIRCREKKCSTPINYAIEDVQRILCSSIIGPDVLIQRICETYDNKGRHSPIGAAGDYLLTKAVQNAILYASINSRMFCTRIIRNTEDRNPESYLRWNTLISDLLLENFSAEPPTMRNGVTSEFSYTWFPKIKMLNLHVSTMTVSLNPAVSKAFQRAYGNDLCPNALKDLDTKLTTKKIRPKLIVLNFPFTHKVRINPGVYVNLTKKFAVYKPEGYPQDMFDDIRVSYYEQLMSFPLLKREANMYPFLVNGINKEYRLKSVAVFIGKEFTNTFGNIRDKYMKPIDGERQLTEPCASDMKAEIIDKLHRDIPNLDQLLSSEMFQSILKIICRFALRGPRLEQANTSSKMFAVVERNDRWIIMNDHFSSYINDIETFSIRLKDEKITSVLLEEP